jgi:hypothetical protein
MARAAAAAKPRTTRAGATAPAKPRTTRSGASAPAKPRMTRNGAATPAKPRTKRAASGAAVAAPAKPRTTRGGAAAPAPRRRSGPAREQRGPAREQRAPRQPTAPKPDLRTALAARGNVLLDRLLRGRLWVGCVGLLLAGIVALNVGLLELNDRIARTDAKSQSIGRENADLRLKLAKLDSTERIQRIAEGKGFVMPAPGAVRYVRSRPKDAREAARGMTAPEPVTPVTAPVPATTPATGAGQVAAPATGQAATPAAAAPATGQAATPAAAAPATGTPAAATPAPTAAAPAQVP